MSCLGEVYNDKYIRWRPISSTFGIDAVSTNSNKEKKSLKNAIRFVLFSVMILCLMKRVNNDIGALKIVISISVIDSLQNLKMMNCKNYSTKSQRKPK